MVRDLRPEDREAAIEMLAASFQGFGPLDQVVGDGDRAQDRRRSVYAMALREGTKEKVIVAVRDGGIEGVLAYGDRPHCIPSARDSLAAVRIAGPRLLAGRRIATCRCLACGPKRRAWVSAGS